MRRARWTRTIAARSGVLLINHGDAPFPIRRGERIAQMVIAAVVRAELVSAASLSTTDRGSGGSVRPGANSNKRADQLS